MHGCARASQPSRSVRRTDMTRRCVMEHRWAIRCWVIAIAIVLNATMPLADAAEDLVQLEGRKEQFTVALPSGWNEYNQSEAVSGEPSPLGVVVVAGQRLTK